MDEAPQPVIQLIMEFECSDGYTYHCIETLPLFHESAEAAAVEFEAAVRRGMKDGCRVEWNGRSFYPSYFFPSAVLDSTGGWKELGPYEAPYFFTIDEWFAHRHVQRP